MRFASWQFARTFTAAVLITAFTVPRTLPAQTAQHVVSPSDLQQAAVDASQTRQQNLDTLNSFLSTDQARQALQSAHVSPQQVKNGVAGLSDEELAQLASRAQKALADFAAGTIGDRDLILIVLAIVVLILLIAIFH
jgi:hypothetical protein